MVCSVVPEHRNTRAQARMGTIAATSQYMLIHTLPCSTLHYTTLHYTTLPYPTPHYPTLPYPPLPSPSPPYPTLHYYVFVCVCPVCACMCMLVNIGACICKDFSYVSERQPLWHTSLSSTSSLSFGIDFVRTQASHLEHTMVNTQFCQTCAHTNMIPMNLKSEPCLG